MDDPLTFYEIIIRGGLAAVGGALVGLERELHDKPAGLRTNMLVGLGAAGFVLTALATTQISAGEGQLGFGHGRRLSRGTLSARLSPKLSGKPVGGEEIAGPTR